MGFEKQVADVDETEFAGEKPEDYVAEISKNKARNTLQRTQNALVLGADTIVDNNQCRKAEGF